MNEQEKASLDVILAVMDYAGVDGEAGQDRWRWILNAINDVKNGKPVVEPPRQNTKCVCGHELRRHHLGSCDGEPGRWCVCGGFERAEND